MSEVDYRLYVRSSDAALLTMIREFLHEDTRPILEEDVDEQWQSAFAILDELPSADEITVLNDTECIFWYPIAEFDDVDCVADSVLFLGCDLVVIERHYNDSLIYIGRTREIADKVRAYYEEEMSMSSKTSLDDFAAILELDAPFLEVDAYDADAYFGIARDMFVVEAAKRYLKTLQNSEVDGHINAKNNPQQEP